MIDPKDGASPYRSFVLRLWPASRSGQAWRITLQEIGREEPRHHFPDLDALFSHLIALTQVGGSSAEGGSDQA